MTIRLLRTAARRARKPVRHVEPDVLSALRRYTWPGNVRQLDFVMRRMVARARSDRLPFDLLPDEIVTPRPGDAIAITRAGIRSKQGIEETLAAEDGNVRRTASRLKISRGRLYRLMQKYGITPPR